MSHGGKKAELT